MSKSIAETLTTGLHDRFEEVVSEFKHAQASLGHEADVRLGKAANALIQVTHEIADRTRTQSKLLSASAMKGARAHPLAVAAFALASGALISLFLAIPRHPPAS